MKIGKLIFLTEFGSHVYGTNIPSSDHDFKGIYIPTSDDILLQKAGRTSFQENTKTDKHAKNSAQDTDIEYITLTGFLRLCAEGQTMSLDMLFTPRRFWKVWTSEWWEIVSNRELLIHSGTSSFFGYAQQQAAKYGLKGSYISALRAVISVLKHLNLHDRLNKHEKVLTELAASTEHVEIFPITNPKTGRTGVYLKVRNCKIELGATVKHALEIYGSLLHRYGERAKAAETNKGVDWKACMHALRVCYEAIELLSSGHVTFPRPEANFLIKVRKGEIPYKEVAELIELGLKRLEIEKAHSPLPDKVDMDAWNRFAAHTYSRQIYKDYPIT